MIISRGSITYKSYVREAVTVVNREIPLISLELGDGRDRRAAVAACLSGWLTALQLLGVQVFALLPKRTITFQP